MKENLKIAVVGGSLSGFGGGAPRSMATHATALRTQGINVTLYAGYSGKYPLTVEQFDLDGMEIVASKLWGPSVLGLNLKALWQLYWRAREYDVIHLNGHWNFTTFTGAIIAKLRKIPYIITTRGHLGKYDFEHLRFLKLFLFPLMEIPNIRKAAIMHVCSEWEKTDSMRALKHAQRIVKVPNAVDCSKLLPVLEKNEARGQLDLPTDTLVYLFLARVAPDKSPELLIRSWATSKRKDDGSILVIAGPYEPEYGKKLRQLADSLQVSGSILFPGYADNESKRKWYSAADVFVLPSTDDSFSVAVIEAASFGLHCILSPYVGASEYIPESQVSIIELKQEAWAEALGTNIPPNAEKNGISIPWEDQFTLNAIGAQWEVLYNEVLCAPR